MKHALRYVLSMVLVFNICLINIDVLALTDSANQYEVDRIKDEIYQVTEEYYEAYHKYDDAGFTSVYSDKFWWPIGSVETTEEGGATFAKGNPETLTITSNFGMRTDPFGSGKMTGHSGLDIAGGRGMGNVNIIAAKSGVVVYPSASSPLSCPSSNSMDNCGGGYGNYVIIEHSDGTYTLYGHMYANSITVRKGDSVSQGQVIGKMGSSGYSTGAHLHFEVRVGKNSSSAAVDPLKYINPSDPRPSGGGQFPVVGTTLSKEEYVHMVKEYSARIGNPNNYFAENAGLIYDYSLEYRINPELVFITALTENGVNKRADGNYWGIGFTTGSSSGDNYSDLRQGIAAYGQLLEKYRTNPGDISAINNMARERQAAGCDPLGYGSPDTLSGTQSRYSSFAHRYNPGDSGFGGCYYLNIIFGSNYCSTVQTCPKSIYKTSKENCPADSKLTTLEACAYTKWQVEKKVQLRFAIFGL